MAIPLIIGAAALVGIGVGAKKVSDGRDYSRWAEQELDEAKSKHSKAKSNLDTSQRWLNERTGKIGKLRLDIGKQIGGLTKMADDLMKKLNSSSQSNHRFDIAIPNTELKRIEGFSYSAMEFSKGLASGAIAGGVAGYAVYGGTMALATASTGTAISTLSGVAATNAALASIGGGSLAAGGLGVAGGTALLGGLVAAPIFAIAAWSYASNAEDNYRKARDYHDDVKKAVEKMNSAESKIDNIVYYIDEVHNATEKMRDVLNQYYNELKAFHDRFIINGENISNFSTRVLQVVNDGMAVAAILTDVAIAPLFKMTRKDGKDVISTDSDKIPLDNRAEVRSIFQEKNTKLVKFS
ncbi:hypothetical protein [Lonepinella sp. MS14436]|uniref:hypothetical protein n=1 Tax=Lonepinella sp. MS14436 TaxID=3003619 RepID=UPI0036DAA077